MASMRRNGFDRATECEAWSQRDDDTFQSVETNNVIKAARLY